MKKTIKPKLLIFIAVCLMLITSIALQPTTNNALAKSDELNTITVVGSSSINLVPDVAIVSLGVETFGQDLLVAEKENATKVQNIINTLLNFKVQENNIKTKNFNVYQQYDYNNGVRKHVGYQITNIIEFQTEQLNEVGKIVSSLIKDGANHFKGVTFSVKNSDEAYLQALELALKNAEDKARRLTNDNVELSIAKIVEERFNSVRPIYDTESFLKTASEEVPLMKGEVNLKANLKVVFNYKIIQDNV